MSIGEDIGKVAELAAPELGISVWALKALGFVVLLGAIWFIVWKLFFADGQARRVHDAAAAQATALVSGAQASAGANAANVVAGNAQQEAKTHEITRDHYVYINQQPGAGDPVSDPVWNAFVSSICVRASAASLPDCQRLRETDSK